MVKVVKILSANRFVSSTDLFELNVLFCDPKNSFIYSPVSRTSIKYDKSVINSCQKMSGNQLVYGRSDTPTYYPTDTKTYMSKTIYPLLSPKKT